MYLFALHKMVTTTFTNCKLLVKFKDRTESPIKYILIMFLLNIF